MIVSLREEKQAKSLRSVDKSCISQYPGSLVRELVNLKCFLSEISPSNHRMACLSPDRITTFVSFGGVRGGWHDVPPNPYTLLRCFREKVLKSSPFRIWYAAYFTVGRVWSSRCQENKVEQELGH